MSDPCEIMIVSADFPASTVTFIVPQGALRLSGGMFRLEYLRPVNDDDEQKLANEIAMEAREYQRRHSDEFE
jgi:hypothetical protein